MDHFMNFLIALFLTAFFSSFIYVPLIILFALHNRLLPPRDQAFTSKRILVYCGLLFALLSFGVTASFASSMNTLVSSEGLQPTILFVCGEAERDDCHEVISIGQREVWLHYMLYPISKDICFTGHDFVCDFLYHREFKYDLALPYETSLYTRTFKYVGFGVVFAIPSVMLYALLWLFYMRPDTHKRKNDERLT